MAYCHESSPSDGLQTHFMSLTQFNSHEEMFLAQECQPQVSLQCLNNLG